MNTLNRDESECYSQCQGRCHVCIIDGACTLAETLKKLEREGKPIMLHPDARTEVSP